MGKFILINVLLFAASSVLAYLKEIDNLERDGDPNCSGKKLIVISLFSLLLSVLFTMLSADAGWIMLTLSVLMFSILVGISFGHWMAWQIFCRRNPDLFD